MDIFYSAITTFAFTSSVNLLQSTPVAGDLVLGQRGQQHSQMAGKKADWENCEDKNDVWGLIWMLMVLEMCSFNMQINRNQVPGDLLDVKSLSTVWKFYLIFIIKYSLWSPGGPRHRKYADKQKVTQIDCTKTCFLTFPSSLSCHLRAAFYDI